MNKKSSRLPVYLDMLIRVCQRGGEQSGTWLDHLQKRICGIELAPCVWPQWELVRWVGWIFVWGFWFVTSGSLTRWEGCWSSWWTLPCTPGTRPVFWRKKYRSLNPSSPVKFNDNWQKDKKHYRTIVFYAIVEAIFWNTVNMQNFFSLGWQTYTKIILSH